MKISTEHSFLLDRNNNKINGLIGQNDYFSKIANYVSEITDLTALLVQVDEKDKSSMALMAGVEAEEKNPKRQTSAEPQ